MVRFFPIYFEPGMEDLFKQRDSASQSVNSLADLAVTSSVGQNVDIATPSETAITENGLPNSDPLASSQPFPPGEPVTVLPASVTSTTETSTEDSTLPEQITTFEQTNISWETSTSTTSATSSLIPTAPSTPTLSTTAVFSTTTSSAPEQTTEQTKSNSATSEPGSYSGGTSTNTKIAISVPVSIIGLALIIALIIFLTRRRRREKEHHNLRPPYDMATSQTRAVSTQELMVSTRYAALSPDPQAPTAAVPLSRLPVLNIPPSSISGQSPDPGPSPSSTRRMSVSQGTGPNDSNTEIGLAVAVPLDHRRSATEQELRTPSRGTVQLARMPFDNSHDPDDDAFSEVSDLDGRRRDRQFDEISDVSSFGAVSPIRDGERRQYR